MRLRNGKVIRFVVYSRDFRKFKRRGNKIMGGLLSSPKAHTIDTLYPKPEELTALENRMYGIANNLLNGYSAPLNGIGQVPVLDADGNPTGEYQKVETAPSPYLLRNGAGNVQRYEPQQASRGLLESLIYGPFRPTPSWDASAFFTPIKTEKKDEKKKASTSTGDREGRQGNDKDHGNRNQGNSNSKNGNRDGGVWV
jgi:hypothetical protein